MFLLNRLCAESCARSSQAKPTNSEISAPSQNPRLLRLSRRRSLRVLKGNLQRYDGSSCLPVLLAIGRISVDLRWNSRRCWLLVVKGCWVRASATLFCLLTVSPWPPFRSHRLCYLSFCLASSYPHLPICRCFFIGLCATRQVV